MFTWEKANQTLRASVLAATFTPEEFAHLYVLREQYQTSQQCGEFGLDLRRLRFVRWLVEHGRISEDDEIAGPATRHATQPVSRAGGSAA